MTEEVAPKDEVKPQEQAQPEVKAEAQKPEQPPETKEEKLLKQSEVDEIIRKKDAKRLRERDEMRKEIEVLRKLALQGRDEPRKEPTPAPQEGKEPVRGDFESYEQFLSAQAQFRAHGTAKAVIKEERDAEAKRVADDAAKKTAQEWRERVKKNSEGIEDFEDVLTTATSDPQSAVSRLPADPIAACDNPAKVLYHFATHPDEAERIASLPPGQQAREIWKTDAAIAAAKPPAKQASKAPAPITALASGSTATVSEMPDPKTDPDGWMKWRNAELRARLAQRRAS